MSRRFDTAGFYALRNGQLVPSLVRSIQRGTISLNGVTSNTTTISAVVPGNALLRHLGVLTSVAPTVGGKDALVRIELTDPTTITAFVHAAPGAPIAVSFEIKEYWPGIIKSIQRGTISNNGTATIASVNMAKTELDSLGTTSAGGDGGANDSAAVMSRFVLTDPTTVTQAAFTEATNVGGYQVAEYF